MPYSQYTPKLTANGKKIGRPSQFLITFQGKTQSVTEWAAETGLSMKLIYNRLTQTKWTPERALTTPVGKNIKTGLGHHSLAPTWYEMHRRCYNPRMIHFDKYGGAGIFVCQGWHSLETFISDVGERPEGQTIDRKDNLGSYTCGHCEQCKSQGWLKNWRWATSKEQQLNRRNNRLITFQGRTQPFTVWADEYGIRRDTLWGRLDRGWEMEKALTQPPMKKRKG